MKASTLLMVMFAMFCLVTATFMPLIAGWLYAVGPSWIREQASSDVAPVYVSAVMLCFLLVVTGIVTLAHAVERW